MNILQLWPPSSTSATSHQWRQVGTHVLRYIVREDLPVWPVDKSVSLQARPLSRVLLATESVSAELRGTLNKLQIAVAYISQDLYQLAQDEGLIPNHSLAPETLRPFIQASRKNSLLLAAELSHYLPL
jgi:hypothetical protein